MAKWRFAKRPHKMFFDLHIRSVERAQIVPFPGVASKIFLGIGFPRLADRGELAPVICADPCEIRAFSLGCSIKSAGVLPIASAAVHPNNFSAAGFHAVTRISMSSDIAAKGVFNM